MARRSTRRIAVSPWMWYFALPRADRGWVLFGIGAYNLVADPGPFMFWAANIVTSLLAVFLTANGFPVVGLVFAVSVIVAIWKRRR